MAEMIVKLTWDDELGPRWMNIDNLRSCLYGETHIAEDAVVPEQVSCSADEDECADD